MNIKAIAIATSAIIATGCTSMAGHPASSCAKKDATMTEQKQAACSKKEHACSKTDASCAQNMKK